MSVCRHLANNRNEMNPVDEIVNGIMYSDNWPNIECLENFERLNEMADDSFSTGSFSGMLSAVLMYHQLVEAMCK